MMRGARFVRANGSWQECGVRWLARAYRAYWQLAGRRAEPASNRTGSSHPNRHSWCDAANARSHGICQEGGLAVVTRRMQICAHCPLAWKSVSILARLTRAGNCYFVNTFSRLST